MPSPPVPLVSLFRSFPLLVSRQSQAQAQSPSPLPLVQGEIVRAMVLNVRGDAGSVTLSVKGRAIELHSNASFRPGETVTLQVDKVHPRLAFRFIGGVEGRPAIPGALAGQFRLYPQALLKAFTEAETVLRGDAMNVLVRILGKQDADRLLPLLRSLGFTRVQAERGFQFRDYLERFGFLMEQQLGRAARRSWGQGPAARAAAENLKGLLLSVEARLAASGERVPPALTQYISSMLKAIETCQVVNSLLGDKEKTFFFQIPLVLAERIELAHILISVDDEKGEGDEEEGTKTAFSLFLDMDSLGPIAARADMVSGKIDCVLTCEKPETVAFLEPFLDELRRSLEKSDFVVGRISCREGPSRFVAEAVAEILESVSTYDTVDMTV